jgi:hypothetical protein
MALPDYTRHEIHIQPGGFVGDEFAGAISLHGFKHFNRHFSLDDPQEHHLAMAQAAPWADHRFNSERWVPEYRGSDFPGVLPAAGFEVKIGPKRPGAFQEVTATKPG